MPEIQIYIIYSKKRSAQCLRLAFKDISNRTDLFFVILDLLQIKFYE